jgi:hypothetical protein
MAYTKICIGISGNDVACSIKIPDNRQYCAVYHEHYQELINTGHTKETIELLDRCVRCKKHLPDVFFTDKYSMCNLCRDLAHKKRSATEKCYICETNKVSRINCGKYIGKNAKKYCASHLLSMNHDDLIFEGKNVCEGHRKVCLTVIEPDKKYCADCDTNSNDKNTYRTNRKKLLREARNAKNCCGSCGSAMENMEFKYCSDCRLKRCAKEKEQRKNGTRIDRGLTREQQQKKQAKIREKKQIDPEKFKLADKLAKARAKVLYGNEYFDKNKKRTSQIRATKRANMTDEEYENYRLATNNNIHNTLKYYKLRANKKQFGGINWDDNINETVLLMLKQKCFYCDEIPPGETHNGIDRIDNNIGYTLENIVPCCTMCNMLKGCLNIDVFLLRIEHILTYKKIINGNTHNNIYPTSHGSSYGVYKNTAEKRNIIFELTTDEFYTLKNSFCYLCGVESSSIHTNGIDKIIPTKGYVFDNCAGCCRECNFLKSTYNTEILFKKFKEIYENKKDAISILYKQLIIRKNIGLYFNKNKNLFNYFYNLEYLDYGEWNFIYDETNKVFEFVKKHSVISTDITKKKNITLTRKCYNFEYMILSQARKTSLNYNVDKLFTNNNKNIVITYDSDIIIRFDSDSPIINITLLINNNKINGIKICNNISDNIKNNFCDNNKKCIDCLNIHNTVQNMNVHIDYGMQGMRHIERNRKNKEKKVDKRQQIIDKAKELIENNLKN